MNTQVFIPTREEFARMQKELFMELLHQEIPKLVRKANRKEYLTTADFEELYGCSRELQKYYRDEGLPYSQEGRKIWYRTEDVERFMDERRVNDPEGV